MLAIKKGSIFWRDAHASIWKLLHVHKLNKSFKHKLIFKCWTNILLIRDSLKLGFSCSYALNCWPNTASWWYIKALCCNVYKYVLAEISWRLSPNTLPCGGPPAHSAIFALKSDTTFSWGEVTGRVGSAVEIWCPTFRFHLQYACDAHIRKYWAKSKFLIYI